MRIALTLLIAILCSQVSYAKVHKFRTFSYTYKVNTDGEWSDWAARVDNSLIVTFDEPKQRITFFGNDAHNYDISKTYDEKTEGGYDTYAFDCVADNGKKCKVEWFQSTTDENNVQVEIIWSDKMWNYQVKLLDE